MGSYIFSFFLYSNFIWWISSKVLRDRNPFISFTVYNMLLTIPLMMASYVIQLIFTIFIPVMGRFGTDLNPDILIGAAVAFFSLLFLFFIFPLLSSWTYPFKIIILVSCFIAFIITVLVVTLSNAGFPYSDDIVHPRAQRL